MTLTNHRTLHHVQMIDPALTEDARIQPDAEEAESLGVSDVTGLLTASTDWAYSGTAEDNGTAGRLDGDRGLTYSGPSNHTVRISVQGMSVSEHGSEAGDSEDLSCLVIFRNSEVVLFGSAGYAAHTTETPEATSIDGSATFNENDVLRVGFDFKGENPESDLDCTAAIFTVS